MEMANRARGKKEEEEMDMGLDPNHSRKRSAKGAKNTKPAKDGMGMKKPMDGGMYGKKPMDGDKGMKKEMEMDMYGKKPMDAECGCKGKKGRKCDANCGSMRKRSDSLTPQEYLTACELGIQDRSSTYIRARLDTAATRNDLKCGKGAISEGEKCTKGNATKVEPKKPTNKAIRQMERNLISKAEKTGQPIKTTKEQTALLLQTRGTQTRRVVKQALTQAKSGDLKTAIRGNKNSKDPANAAVSSLARRELLNRRVQTGARILGGALAVGAVAASSLETRKRDGVYAQGFPADSEARNDLKCGKGAISQGEKCTKGQAIKVEPKKAAAKKEFRAIMNTNKGAQRFVAAKGSTKGVGNKLKLAGEIAAKLGGGASAGLGLAQIYTGAQTGNLGQISRGFRNAQLGGAAVQLANASKASRLGKAGLAKEFAKSAGRQAAVGVGQEAALGAYAGFKRTQGALGLRNSVRSAYQKAQRRRGGVRAYSTSISRRKRDGVYAQGFPADSAKYYV
jgi:hypothetical protein